MSGFFERVGGVLVSPRAAMARLAGSRAGGLGDVMVLMVLRLLAGELRVGGSGPDSSVILVRGLLWLRRAEPMLAAQGVLQSASRLLPDVFAIVVGSVGLSLFGGRRSGGRELDLAAAAWIPALAIHVAGALLFTAIGHDPSPVQMRVLDGAALGWSAIAWAIALWTLREMPRASQPAPPVEVDRRSA